MSTNDLWLEMTAVSNNVSYLTIHPPWDDQNGTWDLWYCTNLDAPIAWQWLLRNEAGETNLVVPNAVDAQGFYELRPPNDLVENDSEGTNFWIAFSNIYKYGYVNLSLYISSSVGAVGTVTIPEFGTTNTFSVAAGSVTNINIDASIMIVDYDMVESNGIQITSSQPVSVYGFNYEEYASVAFTFYPTPLLGTNYCVMSYPGADSSNPSQFAIVATANETTVTITPSPTANLAEYTNAYNETLQQGETYQINDSSSSNDLTGTCPVETICGCMGSPNGGGCRPAP
jgi:hypothetical protein